MLHYFLRQGGPVERELRDRWRSRDRWSLRGVSGGREHEHQQRKCENNLSDPAVPSHRDHPSKAPRVPTSLQVTEAARYTANAAPARIALHEDAVRLLPRALQPEGSAAVR